MFELTKEEYDSLRCQNFTLKNADSPNVLALTSQNVILKKMGRGQHSKYLPFAFTREGIAMLSGLLRSEVAVQANINIMRAFFQMQEALLIVSNTHLQLEQIREEIKQLRTDMNDTLADQNEINELTRVQLDAISDALTELQNQGKNPLALPEIGYTAIQKRREEEEKK
jgi:phage regulator Rha-like protein